MIQPNFPCPQCESTNLQSGKSTYEYNRRPVGAGEGVSRQLISATHNFTCRACQHQFAVRHQYTEPKH